MIDRIYKSGEHATMAVSAGSDAGFSLPGVAQMQERSQPFCITNEYYLLFSFPPLSCASELFHVVGWSLLFQSHLHTCIYLPRSSVYDFNRHHIKTSSEYRYITVTTTRLTVDQSIVRLPGVLSFSSESLRDGTRFMNGSQLNFGTAFCSQNVRI